MQKPKKKYKQMIINIKSKNYKNITNNPRKTCLTLTTY